MGFVSFWKFVEKSMQDHTKIMFFVVFGQNLLLLIPTVVCCSMALDGLRDLNNDILSSPGATFSTWDSGPVDRVLCGVNLYTAFPTNHTNSSVFLKPPQSDDQLQLCILIKACAGFPIAAVLVLTLCLGFVSFGTRIVKVSQIDFPLWFSMVIMIVQVSMQLLCVILLLVAAGKVSEVLSDVCLKASKVDSSLTCDQYFNPELNQLVKDWGMQNTPAHLQNLETLCWVAGSCFMVVPFFMTLTVVSVDWETMTRTRDPTNGFGAIIAFVTVVCCSMVLDGLRDLNNDILSSPGATFSTWDSGPVDRVLCGVNLYTAFPTNHTNSSVFLKPPQSDDQLQLCILIKACAGFPIAALLVMSLCLGFIVFRGMPLSRIGLGVCCSILLTNVCVLSIGASKIDHVIDDSCNKAEITNPDVSCGQYFNPELNPLVKDWGMQGALEKLIHLSTEMWVAAVFHYCALPVFLLTFKSVDWGKSTTKRISDLTNGFGISIAIVLIPTIVCCSMVLDGLRYLNNDILSSPGATFSTWDSGPVDRVLCGVNLYTAFPTNHTNSSVFLKPPQSDDQLQLCTLIKACAGFPIAAVLVLTLCLGFLVFRRIPLSRIGLGVCCCILLTNVCVLCIGASKIDDVIDDSCNKAEITDPDVSCGQYFNPELNPLVKEWGMQGVLEKCIYLSTEMWVAAVFQFIAVAVTVAWLSYNIGCGRHVETYHRDRKPKEKQELESAGERVEPELSWDALDGHHHQQPQSPHHQPHEQQHTNTNNDDHDITSNNSNHSSSSNNNNINTAAISNNNTNGDDNHITNNNHRTNDNNNNNNNNNTTTNNNNNTNHNNNNNNNNNNDDDNNITPNRGASNVDMTRDPHPPWEFRMPAWTSVKDFLYNSPSLNRCALALNTAQENYTTHMSVVAIQGRLFCERACKVLLENVGKSPGARLEVDIDALRNTRHKELVDMLHRLRMFGNRAAHDGLPDIKPNEKPVIVQLAYKVAVYLRDKFEEHPV